MIKGIASRMSKRNHATFKHLYESEYHSIYTYIYSKINDKSRVHDLTQDVFFRLWSSYNSYDSDRPIRPFLFQIAKRLSIDHFRKSKFRHADELQSNDDHRFAEIVPSTELNKDIASCLEEIPQNHKEAFILHHDYGFKYKEIAVFFNISDKTVESWMGKIMKRLREEFKSG